MRPADGLRPQRPPRGGAWNGPRIPQRLLRDFYRIETVKTFRQDKGGIYETVSRTESSFRGALFPINNEDLQYLPEGTSTVDSQKLYTDGDALEAGRQVRDSLDGREYTVITELTHGPVHGLRRYIVTRKGSAASGK